MQGSSSFPCAFFASAAHFLTQCTPKLHAGLARAPRHITCMQRSSSKSPARSLMHNVSSSAQLLAITPREINASRVQYTSHQHNRKTHQRINIYLATLCADCRRERKADLPGGCSWGRVFSARCCFLLCRWIQCWPTHCGSSLRCVCFSVKNHNEHLAHASHANFLAWINTLFVSELNFNVILFIFLHYDRRSHLLCVNENWPMRHFILRDIWYRWFKKLYKNKTTLFLCLLCAYTAVPDQQLVDWLLIFT